MKNKGFSIVEIIIVIALMAVVSGVFVLSLNVQYSASTNKCAEQINSLLEKTRITTMSKKDIHYLVIYQDTNDHYYASITKDVLAPTEPVDLGSARIAIFYDIKDDITGAVTEYEVSTSNPLTITFDQSSGSFVEYAPNQYVDRISIKGSKDGDAVTLSSSTGRHYVE